MKVNSATTQSIQNKDIAGASGAKRTDKSSAAESASKAGTAAIDSSAVKPEISSKAREFSQAKDIASNASDVREEKIAELKRRIASGTYQVNAQAIADKMVDEHMSSGIG
jgi:negative regulator of flagellin synthesis FlgM